MENQRLISQLLRPNFPTNVEIILVIDQERIEQFQYEDISENLGVNLRVVQSHFGAPGLARNFGLEYATADWICFWDCDDIPIVENILEEISISGTNRNIIIGSYQVLSDQTNLVLKHQVPFSDLDYLTGVGVWRMVFRRDAISNIRFSNLIWGEDTLFIAELELGSRDLYISPKCFYKYYVGSPNQLTSSSSSAKIDSLRSLSRKLQKIQKMEPKRLDISLLLFKNQITLLKHRRSFLPTEEIVDSVKLAIIMLTKRSLNYKYWSVITKWLINHKREFITIIPLGGGLGNQLFQYSAFLNQSLNQKVKLDISLSKPRLNKTGEVELFDLVSSPDSLTLSVGILPSFVSKVFGYNRRWKLYESPNTIIKIYTRCISSLASVITSIYFKRRVSTYYCEDLGFEQIPNSSQNQVVFGYFQSYRWAIQEEVRDVLKTLKPLIRSKNFEELISRVQECTPIVVQIRLTDYALESSFGLLSGNYYKKVFSQIDDELLLAHPVWLFSDDPEMAMAVLPKEIRERVFVVPTTLSSSETLEIMKYGSAYVIANSSFGWWGAFLRKNESAVVYAPSPWFANITEPRDLFPPDWKIIESNFREFEK